MGKSRQPSRKELEARWQQRVNESAREEYDRRRRKVIGWGLLGVVALVVAVVAVVINQTKSPEKADPHTALYSPTVSATASPAPFFDGDAPSSADLATVSIPVGKDSAKVRIDLFEDFQCSGCEQFEKTMGATVDSLVQAGTVKVYYHPLTFLDTNMKTTYSTRAAQVALCAADQGRYAEVHKALYSQYPGEGKKADKVTTDDLIARAHAAGVTGSEFDSCARSTSYAGFLAASASFADQTLARDYSKDGKSFATPSMYINGSLFNGSKGGDRKAYTTPATLTEIVDKAAAVSLGQRAPLPGDSSPGTP